MPTPHSQPADFSIDPSSDFQGIANAQVKEILVPVEMLLQERSCSAPAHPVEVYARDDHPQVDLIGGVQRIGLTAQQDRYLQYAYQFAHEYAHVLTNWQDGKNSRYKWFEETLAEFASLFVVQSFAESQEYGFETEEWIDYLEDVKRDHTDNRLKNYRIGPAVKARSWFPQLLPVLAKNDVIRELNGAIAAELLPHFMERPKLWRALAFLNRWDTGKNQDFRDYLASWTDMLRKSGESVNAVHVVSGVLYGEGSAAVASN